MQGNGDLVAIQPLDQSFINTIKVEWFIGLLCNFSCTYCAEWDRSGFADTEKILRGVDKLVERVGHRRIVLLLGGGEPSIHPDIHKIAHYMASKKIWLSMISNGSRPPSLYVDWLKHIRGYTFSVHFEQRYDRTLNTVRAVHRAIQSLPHTDRYMQVNVMMVPGHFAQAREVIAELEQLKVNYIIRRVRPLFDAHQRPILPEKIKDRPVGVRDNTNAESFRSDHGYYSAEELDYLNSLVFKVKKNTEEIWHGREGSIERVQSNANDISLRKLNRFKGWECWIGVERLHIYPNGDVYRSTCKVGGKLGNLYEDFNAPNGPVTCDRERCTCNWAIQVSKSRAPTYKSLLHERPASP